MKNFEGFGLSADLYKSLSKMNYTTPTPIQAKAIPLALEGKDILGSAQTGTGKTAAFSIPLIEKMLNSSKGMAVVLTPTRELAKQVLDVIHQLLGHQSPIKTAFLIGGEAMHRQLKQLRREPRIIVGTPGRINDHLDRGTLMLNRADFLVLDETDRMLDMGFGVQIDRILEFMPRQRQTLMFSATLPQAIIKMSGRYLNNPERVSMGATNVIAQNIKQDVIRISQEAKYKELINQLHEREGSVIVFVKTKHGTERMAKNLYKEGFETDALHGDLRQNKRNVVMKGFRDKKFRILIATDIAARGLDVPHIQHVINYDLPQVAEDYIHRMGRTARAGSNGSALSFVTNQDGRKWGAIERLLNPGQKSKSRFADDRDERSSRGGPRRGGKPSAKRFGKKRPGERSDRRSDNRKSDWNSEGRPERGEERRSDNRGFGKKPYAKKKFADRREEGGRTERSNSGWTPQGRSEEKSVDDRRNPNNSFSKRSGKPFGKRTSVRDENGGRSEERSYRKKPAGKSFGKSFKKRDENTSDRPSSKSFGKRSEGHREDGGRPEERSYNKKPSGRSFGKPGKKTFGKKSGNSFGNKMDGQAPRRRNKTSQYKKAA